MSFTLSLKPFFDPISAATPSVQMALHSDLEILLFSKNVGINKYKYVYQWFCPLKFDKIKSLLKFLLCKYT